MDISGEKKEKAASFIQVLTGDFSKEEDNVPVPLTLKHLLRDVLGGYIRHVIEYQYSVLIIGLENEDHSLKIQGQDMPRIHCIGMFLEMEEELRVKTGLSRDDETSKQFSQLLREVGEQLATRSIIEPLNVDLKRRLWNLITHPDYPPIDKERIREINRGRKGSRTLPAEPQMPFESLSRVTSSPSVPMPSTSAERFAIFEEIF